MWNKAKFASPIHHRHELIQAEVLSLDPEEINVPFVAGPVGAMTLLFTFFLSGFDKLWSTEAT